MQGVGARGLRQATSSDLRARSHKPRGSTSSTDVLRAASHIATRHVVRAIRMRDSALCGAVRAAHRLYRGTLGWTHTLAAAMDARDRLEPIRATSPWPVRARIGTARPCGVHEQRRWRNPGRRPGARPGRARLSDRLRQAPGARGNGHAARRASAARFPRGRRPLRARPRLAFLRRDQRHRRDHRRPRRRPRRRALVRRHASSSSRCASP